MYIFRKKDDHQFKSLKNKFFKNNILANFKSSFYLISVIIAILSLTSPEIIHLVSTPVHIFFIFFHTNIEQDHLPLTRIISFSLMVVWHCVQI